jgi:hypothetical protein
MGRNPKPDPTSDELTQLATERERLEGRQAVERIARESRDQAIRNAYARGHSLRDVAKVAGLTHAGVAKIVKAQP